MTTSPAVADGPVVPAYGTDTLTALLPGVVRALGVPTDLTALPLPLRTAYVVVIIDGLGAQQLADTAADHPDTAPFLSGLIDAPRPDGCPDVLRVGCPTTTATSMTSFGTGLPPGQHGLVGYQVRDPQRGVLLNHLRWDPYTDPLAWQPHPTLFTACIDAGVPVTRIGAPEFEGSGLTIAAHRGGRFVGITDAADRVNAALAAVAHGGLVYLYTGDVDAAGHEFGWRSQQWRAALTAADTELARLAAALPTDVGLVITADHGMVDVPVDLRLDIATVPSLRQGVAILGGEPRMTQLYTLPGQQRAVLERFTEAVADRGWVVTRDRAIAAGWFGPVAPHVHGRIGDVLIAARHRFAVVDAAVMRPRALALVGQHGSLTEAEQLVPLLVAA